MSIKKRVKKMLDAVLDDNEVSPATLRKRKSNEELIKKGGSIVKVRLSAKATQVLESLSVQYGDKTKAIESILCDYEQRSLL